MQLYQQHVTLPVSVSISQHDCKYAKIKLNHLRPALNGRCNLDNTANFWEKQIMFDSHFDEICSLDSRGMIAVSNNMQISFETCKRAYFLDVTRDAGGSLCRWPSKNAKALFSFVVIPWMLLTWYKTMASVARCSVVRSRPWLLWAQALIYDLSPLSLLSNMLHWTALSRQPW